MRFFGNRFVLIHQKNTLCFSQSFQTAFYSKYSENFSSALTALFTAFTANKRRRFQYFFIDLWFFGIVIAFSPLCSAGEWCNSPKRILHFVTLILI